MSHHQSQIIEGKSRWLAAAAAALIINLMLLSILPVVNLGTIRLPKHPPPVQAINFIRRASIQPVQPKPPDQPPETLPKPNIPDPSPRETFDLTPESLERMFRPDFQTIPLVTKTPGLTDIPLADVDFSAMAPGDIFDADDLDKPLIPVSRVPPFYPLQARRASIEGWVEVSFLVSEQGRVSDIRIRDAEPPGVFEESVRQTVSGWRFRPGTIMGEPVKARVITTIRFELEANQ